MERSVRAAADCDGWGDVGGVGRTDSTLPDSNAEETCKVKSAYSRKGDSGTGSGVVGGERAAGSLEKGSAAQVPSATTPKASQRHCVTLIVDLFSNALERHATRATAVLLAPFMLSAGALREESVYMLSGQKSRKSRPVAPRGFPLRVNQEFRLKSAGST